MSDMYETHPVDQAELESKAIQKPEIVIHQPDTEVWVVSTEQHQVSTKLESQDPRIAEKMSERKQKAAAENSSFTWRKTIESQDWQNHLWEFVKEYLANDPVGQNILKECKVTDVQELTPSQAIYVSTALVSALKAYDQQHIIDQPNVDRLVMQGHLGHSSYSPDTMTVLEILQLGQQLNQKAENGSTPDITTGNGVCRNFADAVRAVYEVLKNQQRASSYLHHTYCVQEVGGEDHFDPKIKKESSTDSLSRSGHAWNRFITIEDGRELHTVVDSTWSKLDASSGRLSQYDYSFKRSFKPFMDGCRQELNTDPSPERKKQLIADMVALTDKALKDAVSSEVVMDDELRAHLHQNPKFQQTVIELQQTGVPTSEAITQAEELYRVSLTNARKEPQTAFYVDAFISATVNDIELLSDEQRQKLRNRFQEFIPDNTRTSLEFLFKLGATPRELAHRMEKFISQAVEDDKIERLMLPNPWLQVWVYALAEEETIKRLEAADVATQNNVWYVKSAGMREHQPGEPFYQTANEFWYDLWRGLTNRTADQTPGEMKAFSYSSKAMTLWLDVLAYVWNQETLQRHARFASYKRPRDMTEDSLRKIFSFAETKKLLEAFIMEAKTNLSQGKKPEITFFSDGQTEITENQLNQITQLVGVMDKASTTPNRMEKF